MFRWWKPRQGRQVRTVSTLDRAQRAALFGWAPDVFSSRELALTWESAAERHFLAFQDGALVGHAAHTIRTIDVGGQAVRVSGLGGLVTLPHARDQGVARHLIDSVITFSAKDTDAEFLVLFCLDPLVPFYQRLGFHEVTAPVTIGQPDGPLPCPLHTFHRPLQARNWPDGPVVIAGLPW